MLLSFVGIATDAHERMVDMGVRMGAGHVVIQGKGFQEQQTLDQVVEDPAAVYRATSQIQGVAHAVSRIHVSGLLSTGEASAAVFVAGVDPKLEPQVSVIASKEKRLHGAYLRPRSELPFENAPGDIYIGEELAKKLQLALGDRTVLTVSPRGGGPTASAAFIVRGIFHTGLDDLDGFHVQISLKEAKKLVNLEGAVTQVALLLHDQDDTAQITAKLRAALSDRQLEILPWQEYLRELYETIAVDDAGLYMMMAIIFIIVLIGIFNAVLMSVVERTREFGLMMAMGTSKSRLRLFILTEALVLAVISGAIGLGLGLSAHAWMASTGLDMSVFYGEGFAVSGIVLDGRIYSKLSATTVVQWTVAVMAMVVLSAVYPALRATKLKPVEALRHA